MAVHARVGQQRRARPTRGTLLKWPTITSAGAVTCLAALSVTLVRVANYAGSKTVLQTLVLLSFVAAIAWAIPRQPQRSFLNLTSGLMLLVAFLIFIALWRGAKSGAYGTTTSAVGVGAIYVATVALGIILVTTSRSRDELERRMVAVVLAPAVYMTVQMVASVAGLPSHVMALGAEGTPAQLLGKLGVSATRTIFPLASSINLYGVLVAAALAGVVVLRLRAPNRISRPVAWGLALLAVYSILASDSRAPLAVSIAVILLFALNKRMRGASGIAAVIPLLPLIIVAGLGLLANSGIADVLSRSGGTALGSFSTASGRLYIWQGSWDVLRHWSPEQLIGWGAGGHITSGAALHYAFVFPNNPLAYTAFTHDIVLQTIFDQGYLGLVVLAVAVWRTLVVLQRDVRENGRSPAAALAATLLVIILCGATEVSPTYYSQEALMTTLLIMGMAAGLSASGSKPWVAARLHLQAPKRHGRLLRGGARS